MKARKRQQRDEIIPSAETLARAEAAGILCPRCKKAPIGFNGLICAWCAGDKAPSLAEAGLRPCQTPGHGDKVAAFCVGCTEVAAVAPTKRRQAIEAAVTKIRTELRWAESHPPRANVISGSHIHEEHDGFKRGLQWALDTLEAT